eukprot:12338318-Heterocapsa_arctica.AAC.1
MDCRDPPLIWEGDVVTSFLPDPDGLASYGRVPCNGTRGVVPISISISNATRNQAYTTSSSEHIGHYHDGRALMPYKASNGLVVSTTHKLDAVAASAEVR